MRLRPKGEWYHQIQEIMTFTHALNQFLWGHEPQVNEMEWSIADRVHKCLIFVIKCWVFAVKLEQQWSVRTIASGRRVHREPGRDDRHHPSGASQRSAEDGWVYMQQQRHWVKQVQVGAEFPSLAFLKCRVRQPLTGHGAPAAWILQFFNVASLSHLTI